MLADFALLCEQLAGTTKKLEKRALMAAYLGRLSVEDAARAALYLAGAPFAETDPRRLQVGGSTLSRAVAQLSGANAESMHAAYRRHGDLGDAALDLLSARLAPEPKMEPTLTVADLEEAFTGLALARGPAAKLAPLLGLLGRATPMEARYIIKLATGDMRTGVKQSLVEEAVAAAYGVDAASLRKAVMLNGSLAEVVRMAAAGTLAEARMRLFHPLGFMLASPVNSVDEAMDRFAQEIAAEVAAETSAQDVTHAAASFAIEVATSIADEISTGELQPPSPEQAAAIAANAPPPRRAAQLEDKYDGIRAQLHCGDASQPGRVGLFSRNREDLAASFPDLIEAFSAFGEEVILDGEILAWQPVPTSAASISPASGSPANITSREPTAALSPAPNTSGRALPFASLQQRLGRKRVTREMRQATPVVFMVFDLLYQAGDLLLERPLSERRARLESLIAAHASSTDSSAAVAHEAAQGTLFSPPPEDQKQGNNFARLMLAPAVRLESAEQLDAAYTEARSRGNEGVMLKAAASLYQPGRRGLAWLKLKRELATLDVVITGAEFGNGRRAGVLSDYTFAVRGPASEGKDGELLNIGKAYSGLTDKEIDELSRQLQEQTIEEYGSFRTVEPTIVLEVAFNNVTRSTRHASGFALRFPRILRIRTDKPVEEVDTLARVEEIYASQPDKPVEG
jgi:DNA ligase-1